MAKLKNKELIYKLSLFVIVFVSINLMCAGSVFGAAQNSTNTSNIIPQTNLTQMNYNVTTDTQNATTNTQNKVNTTTNTQNKVNTTTSTANITKTTTANTTNVTDQENSTFPIKGYYIDPTDTPASTIDPATLKAQGITDIFVLTELNNPQTTLAPFVTKFAGTGIDVYAWVECFDDFNGNWYNPEDNITFENEIIDDISSVATNYNINGVMLDNLQFLGNAYEYPNATKDVDSFAATVRTDINTINSDNIANKPKLLLSIALMPEDAVNDYYYGQNYSLLSQYMDFLSPEIYVGNYNETTSWIGTTMQYIISQANGVPVVAILQTYASDSNPTPISTSQLDLDIYTALDNGSNGYELFRYGLMPANFTGYESPLIVTTVTPGKNAVNVPDNQIIKITFSESIESGSMWIVLQNSSGVTIPITTSINGNILTITPESLLANGNYILTLHTGSVTDLSGNPQALWGTNFNVYITPPTIKSITPGKNAIDVQGNQSIAITFTEPIKAGSLWIVLQNSSGVSIPITTSINGNILTITPNTMMLTKGEYILTLHTGCVTGLAGIPLKLWGTNFGVI